MSETLIGPLSDFPEGELVPVHADGQSLIVAHVGDAVHVAVNKCPHLGLSLTRGPGGLRYADGVVQCPWHNSRFDVCSGENLDWVSGFAGHDTPRWSRQIIALGRKPRDLTTLAVRVENDEVFVTTT